MWKFLASRKQKQSPKNRALYHGSFDEITHFRPLSHFGPLQIACNRLDELFTVDSNSSERSLENTKIYEVAIGIHNALRVTDAWEDNHFGIAGERLFSAFPEAKRREIDFVLQPMKYRDVLSSSNRIVSEGIVPSEQLRTELQREGLLKVSDGEAFDFELRTAIASTRFVKLAQKYKYDGLVYGNMNESNGSHDCWINFSSAQVTPTGKVYAYVDYKEDQAVRRSGAGDSKYVVLAAHVLKLIP